MRRLAGALLFLAVSAATWTASAEQLIQNDSASDTVNGLVGTAAIIDGEGYEAIFDIPSNLLPENSGRPLELKGVQVLMVNGDGNDPLTQMPVANPAYCGRFNVTVWAEPAGAPTASPESTCFLPDFSRPRLKDPGTPIFDFESATQGLGFEISGQPNMGQVLVQDLRFAVANMNPQVTLNPVMITDAVLRVRVQAIDHGCLMPGNLYPVMVADLDGATPGKNYIYGGLYSSLLGSYLCSINHYMWEDFGPGFAMAQPGDWVIRLIVDDGTGNMGGDDMGMGDMGMSDMGMGDDMGDDMGVDPMDMDPMDMATGDDMNTPDDGGDVDMGGEPGVLTIESVSPDSGENDTSTDIVIIGTGFDNGIEVLLGAESIGVTETRPTRIRATVPDGLDPGIYDLIVTNPNDDTASLADAFEVLEATGENTSGTADDGCGCDSVSNARTTGYGALLASLLLIGFALRRRNGYTID